jgi:hypothetical protein
MCAIAVAPVFAAGLFGAGDGMGNEAQKTIRLTCGVKVECTTTGSTQQNGQPSVVIMSDDSISCPLNEGDTTFVVTLPNSGAPERLKFVNENAAARGTLKIAVSNEALPPNSTRWMSVDGNVSFRHKRLFNLSVVGVEAKFVRVTFSVERETRELTLALRNFEPAKRDLLNTNLGDIPSKRISLGDSLGIVEAPLPVVALNP